MTASQARPRNPRPERSQTSRANRQSGASSRLRRGISRPWGRADGRHFQGGRRGRQAQFGNFPVIEGQGFLEGQKQGLPQVAQFLAQPLFLLPDEFHQGDVDLGGDMVGQGLGEFLK